MKQPRGRFTKSILGLKLCVCLVSMLGLSAMASAEEAGNSCVPRGVGASSTEIAGFKSDPASLLADSPSGGGVLASAIRRIATSDSTTLDQIAKIISTANLDQSRSIGAGLGQAAILCRAKHADVATEIQEMIVKADRREVLASFQAVVGDTLTAAINNSNNDVDNSSLITETLPGGAPYRGTGAQPRGGVASSSPTQLFLVPSASSGASSFSLLRSSTTAFQSVSPSR
jgi:hypothetical protein